MSGPSGTPAPTGCVRRGAEYPRRKRGRETMRAVGDAGPYGVRPSGCGISPPEVWKRNDAGRRGRRPLRVRPSGCGIAPPEAWKKNDAGRRGRRPLRGASIGVRNSPAGSVEEKRCGPSGTPAPTGCVHRGAEYPHRRHERKTMRAVGDAGPYGCVHRGAPENKDRKRKNNFLMWTEKGNRRGPRRVRGEGEVYICAETKSRSAAYGRNAICAAGRSGGAIATTAWPVRTCAGSVWRISPPRSWRCTR